MRTIAGIFDSKLGFACLIKWLVNKKWKELSLIKLGSALIVPSTVARQIDYITILMRSWHDLNHMHSQFWFNRFVRKVELYMILLFRIFSIVRISTVRCNLDGARNRDDDATRSALSRKHVAGFCLHDTWPPLIDDCSISSLGWKIVEVIAFWAVFRFKT